MMSTFVHICPGGFGNAGGCGAEYVRSRRAAGDHWGKGDTRGFLWCHRRQLRPPPSKKSNLHSRNLCWCWHQDFFHFWQFIVTVVNVTFVVGSGSSSSCTHLLLSAGLLAQLGLVHLVTSTWILIYCQQRVCFYNSTDIDLLSTSSSTFHFQFLISIYSEFNEFLLKMREEPGEWREEVRVGLQRGDGRAESTVVRKDDLEGSGGEVHGPVLQFDGLVWQSPPLRTVAQLRATPHVYAPCSCCSPPASALIY